MRVYDVDEIDTCTYTIAQFQAPISEIFFPIFEFYSQTFAKMEVGILYS